MINELSVHIHIQNDVQIKISFNVNSREKRWKVYEN